MEITELSELLNNLVGTAPEGLEWLTYLFSCLLVLFGLIIVCSIIGKFFSIFDKH